MKKQHTIKSILDKHLHHVPVLVLDVNEEFQDNAAAFDHLVAKTETFIDKFDCIFIIAPPLVALGKFHLDVIAFLL